MKGFIFGFQRVVWCPKWTPASSNSGTNSVVSAIREIPEGGSFQSGSVKMLQHPPMRNLKLTLSDLDREHVDQQVPNWKLVIFSLRISPRPNRDRKAD